MAQITIPIGPGGAGATIDVPDFAMESTQRGILATQQDLLQALTGVQQSNKGVSQGDQQVKSSIRTLSQKIEKAQKDQTDQHREKMRADVKNVTAGMSSAGRQAIDVMQGGAKGLKGMFSKMGLGMIATQFGMVQQVAEDMGNALSYGGRIGLSFGGDIIKTSEQLAKSGLSIGDFTSIVGSQQSAIRAVSYTHLPLPTKMIV